MNIKPLGDRVLVKPFEEEKVTESGIIMPDTVDKEKKAEGVVVALGSGEELKKLDLKIGDKVLFEKWGGEDVKSDGLNYKILPFDKMLAVVE